MTNNTKDVEQKPDFGDYIWFEQKRYGVPNEDYQYKVVNRLRSNAWRHVPVDANDSETHLHDHNEEVVTVICVGVNETKTERFRAADIKRLYSPIQQEANRQKLELLDELANNRQEMYAPALRVDAVPILVIEQVRERY